MAYLFKIQIQGINPPVWRRLLVPENITFSKFHNIIQVAFGWENEHPYEFSPSGWGSSPTIGSQFEKYFEDGAEMDSEKVKLSDVFQNEKRTFTYIYDFEDEWVHEIVLEKVVDNNTIKASCVDGDGACPPEDCGGALDYMDFVEIIRDPQHPQYMDMLDWVALEEGETWEEIHAFDLKMTNERVERL